MAKQFDVHFRTDAKNLAVILQTIDGSAELISVTPFTPEPVKKMKVLKEHKQKQNAERITGDAILLNFLNQKGGNKFSLDEIGTMFVQNGFARNSASPVVSKAKSRGLIRMLGKGYYQAVAK